MTLRPRWSLRFQVSQACGCRQAWAVTPWAVPTIIPRSTEGKLRHGLLGLVAVSPVSVLLGCRLRLVPGSFLAAPCTTRPEQASSPPFWSSASCCTGTPPPQSVCTSQPPRAREAWCVRSPVSPEPHLPQIPCYRRRAGTPAFPTALQALSQSSLTSSVPGRAQPQRGERLPARPCRSTGARGLCQGQHREMPRVGQ